MSKKKNLKKKVTKIRLAEVIENIKDNLQILYIEENRKETEARQDMKHEQTICAFSWKSLLNELMEKADTLTFNPDLTIYDR